MPSLRIWIFLTIIVCILISSYYTQLQTEHFDETTCVIYTLHEKHGLFADLFFLIETYIRSKRANIPFFVDSTNWSYKIDKGWHDFFKSLNEISPDIKSKYSNIIVCSHSNVNRSINTETVYTRDYVHAIKEIFVLNDDLIDRATRLIQSYGESYEAIFIRRGDKITSGESPYRSTDDILSQVTLDPKQPLFVQTDDFNEINNIRSILKDNIIYYTVSETRKGDVESDRQHIDLETKKQNTDDFLVGVYICTKAKSCWVDALSNIGRFIKLYAIQQVHFYKVGDETPVFNIDKNTDDITHKNLADITSFTS